MGEAWASSMGEELREADLTWSQHGVAASARRALAGWAQGRFSVGPGGGACCLVPLFPKCSATPLGHLSLLVFAKHRLPALLLRRNCFCRFPVTAQLFLLRFSGYKLIFKKELELEPESLLLFLHDLVEKLHYGVQQLSPVVLPPSLLTTSACPGTQGSVPLLGFAFSS